MSNNNANNVIKGTQIIVEKAISQISFDKTVKAIVVEQDRINKNKYKVKENNIIFTAINLDGQKEYRVNDKVFVIIPQGNYELEKVIIGGYTEEQEELLLATEPFDNFAIAKTFTKDSSSIQFPVDGVVKNFDYVGIRLRLNVSMSPENSYDIQFAFKDKGGAELLGLWINSDEIFGNPYYITEDFQYEFLFAYPKDLDKKKIASYSVALIKSTTSFTAELIDYEIHFGYKKSTLSNSLVLQTTGNEKYADGENLSRDLYISWSAKDIINEYNDALPKDHKAYLCQYEVGYSLEDGNSDIGGVYWKTLLDNITSLDTPVKITLNGAEQIQQYKVLIVSPNKNEDEEEETIVAQSAPLIFYNKDYKVDPAIQAIDNGIVLSLNTQGDDGVYNLYGYNSKIITSQNNKYSIKAEFSGGYSWPGTSGLDVTWKIPATNTMIQVVKDSGFTKDENGEYYVLTQNKIMPNSSKHYNIIEYELKEEYFDNRTNNTIICEVTRYDTIPALNGKKYSGSITLRFGKASTMGTRFSLNIKPQDYNVLSPRSSKTFTAELEDENGAKIDIDTKNLTWGWYYSSYSTNLQQRPDPGEGKEQNLQLTQRASGANERINCIVSWSTTKLRSAEIAKAILKCQYKIKNDTGDIVYLETYYPIPLGLDSGTQIYGPKTVTYNETGSTPVYDNVYYELVKNDGSKIETPNVRVVNQNSKYYPNDLSIPQILEEETKYYLKPLKLIPVTQTPCATWLYNGDGEPIAWAPLLIIKNVYNSALLNTWDGGTVVKEGTDNYILSAMVGAGKKNNNNQFTGVLMGTVGGKTGLNAKTGLYGYQNGELRFKFDEDGNAFIGTGPNNCITFTESDGLSVQAKKFKFLADKSVIIDSNPTASQPYYINFKNWFSVTSDYIQLAKWYIGKHPEHPTRSETDLWSLVNKYQFKFNSSAGGYGDQRDWISVRDYKNYPEGSTAPIELRWPFRVNGNGKLYATGAKISGDLTANLGNIAGWLLDVGDIHSENYEIFLGSTTRRNIDIAGFTMIDDYCFTVSNNFGIRENGSVICNDIYANFLDLRIGILSGWNIQDFDDKEQRVIHSGWGSASDSRGITIFGSWVNNNNNYAIIVGDHNVKRTPEFIVDFDGNLTVKALTVTEAIEAGGNISGKEYFLSSFSNKPIIAYQGTNKVAWGDPKLTSELLGKWYDWYGDEVSKASYSDINKKNSISALSNQYENFYNMLSPVKFKYNDGTSGRFHTGFIAQDVENAIISSGLNTLDFAGLIKDNNDYLLRYEEFIALNTWQIQKLKTRVAELENKLASLEAQ